jgi:hypothetical protein
LQRTETQSPAAAHAEHSSIVSRQSVATGGASGSVPHGAGSTPMHAWMLLSKPALRLPHKVCVRYLLYVCK